MTNTLAERLWRRVEKLPNGCWEWQGYCHPTRGYGQIGRGSRAEGLIETHRAAWLVLYGEIPPGMHVLHHCDNPPCVNPAHLWLGTNADNSADKVAKGRHARGSSLPHTKLTDDQVREIRARYVQRWSLPQRGGRRSNARELAQEFGVSPGYIQQIAYRLYRTEVA